VEHFVPPGPSSMAGIAMHSLRLRIVALLVGLATVLPGGAFVRPHYFCRMMDRVMAAPCCEAEREVRETRREDQISAPDCCVRVETSARDVAAAAREALAEVPVASLVATIAEPFSVPLAVGRSAPRRARARAPPSVGPPLFIAHCALLI
jgi:hypothetical protein